MKSLKATLIVAALALSLLAGGMAFAERSPGSRGYKGSHYSGHKSYYGGGHRHSYYRSGVDVVIGGSFWVPPWYYPPYYYSQPSYAPYYTYSYAPIAEVPSEPPVYIERSRPDSSALPNVWFYCPESETYYPYVKECTGGWQTVPAKPPSEQGR